MTDKPNKIPDLSDAGPYATAEDQWIVTEHNYASVEELRRQRYEDDLLNAAEAA